MPWLQVRGADIYARLHCEVFGILHEALNTLRVLQAVFVPEDVPLGRLEDVTEGQRLTRMNWLNHPWASQGMPERPDTQGHAVGVDAVYLLGAAQLADKGERDSFDALPHLQQSVA